MFSSHSESSQMTSVDILPAEIALDAQKMLKEEEADPGVNSALREQNMCHTSDFKCRNLI